jgi:predicted transcriptional regulator
MLCFFGPNLEKHDAALKQLMDKDLLVKEQFKGAYSLTRAGFEAMRTCET